MACILSTDKCFDHLVLTSLRKTTNILRELPSKIDYPNYIQIIVPFVLFTVGHETKMGNRGITEAT